MSKLFIRRGFTKNCLDVYECIKFKEVKSTLKNFDGSIVNTSAELIVPEHWSQMAVDILARNYLRKKGVPKYLKKIYDPAIPEWLRRSSADPAYVNETEGETDARKVFDRLAGAWTYWGFTGGYFDEENARNFFDEIRYMLAMQIASPNSPQWFNTGLHWAYGITGSSQGHYYFDEITRCLKKTQSSYERPQPHACFIQSVRDDLVNKGGIMDLWINEARLFKYGSGTGSNFSNIRGKGELLSGGGYSSGLMSFLKIGDVVGGAIKSGGTTRRAAKMVIVDIDHPDVESFINWKMEEETKVIDLVVGSVVLNKYTKEIIENYHNKQMLKQIIENNNLIPQSYTLRILSMIQEGWNPEHDIISLDWENGAHSSVFGQNSNNSVRVTDKFLYAVENNADFNLIKRCDRTVAKTVQARYLWDQIAKAAWACADPGLQFDTTINSWNTCSNDERINASNPCSEYMFLDDTACNLAALNLCTFLNDNKFDIQQFKHAVELWVIVLEISVHMAQFPTDNIAMKSYQYRTLGLGFGNLGAFLMNLAIPYDSDLGRHTTAGITALMQGIAYLTSSKIAKCLGSFERFNINKDCMMKVIRNHARAAGVENLGSYEELNIEPMKFDKKYCALDLSQEVEQIWRQVIVSGEQYGFRNAQVSVIAPTGTSGLAMDFQTTGIEPQFAQVVIKQLCGGGVFKFVNNSISNALKILHYTDVQIQDIERYVIGHGKFSQKFENWLYSSGFVNEDLIKIQAVLKNTFNITQAFSFHVLGKDFFTRIKISESEYQKTDFNLLKLLGANDEDIAKESIYCCGNMTIEGAPHLKIEHLAIFDCAIPSGNGTRCLSYESHIKMMAAIQPFISGAISKTINTTQEATVKDLEDAYMLSWKLGLKSVAIYRDNSKYSQVLTTNTKKNLNQFLINDRQSQPAIQNVETKIIKEQANDFFKPFRRRGYTQHVLIGESSLWHTTGEDENGKLRNVLLSYGKEGSTLRGWVSAWGRILSMYLQEKEEAALLRVYKAFKHSKFEPMGAVIGHPNIKYATSIPDYIVEDLVQAYPNMINCNLEASSLPSQRSGTINKIKIGQETIYLIVGEHQGKPCEIFVTGVGNEGSDLRGWMNSCAKLISLYLQACPETAVWQFIHAFEGSSFEPSGFVEGHPFIKLATSPLDFFAKHLRHYYGHLYNNEQIQLPLHEDKKKLADASFNDKYDYFSTEKINVMSGYKIDEPCTVCRAFKLRYNGTCYICENCFNTTGCS